jgi:hypothetical protein
MLTLRTLAIGMATAGVLAALPLTNAQACDDDRFPCPIVTDNSQSDAAETPRKKANRAARPDEKARAKAERPAGRTPAGAKESTPTAQAPAADAGSQPEPEAVPAATSSPERPAEQSAAAADITRNESPAAAAANAWLRANADGAETRAPSESGEGAAEVAAGASLADGVRVVDPNEVNELDLASSPAPVEGAWIGYLVMMVGGALAAASTARFFLA